MTISYFDNRRITAQELSALFAASGIRRPVDDLPRLEKMLAHANLLWTAWDGDRLVGVARALTDFSFCCYLSDLAVDQAWQRKGIGRELVRRVREATGPQCAFLLLAAPGAMDYYPGLGFEAATNAWIIKRSS